MKTTTKPKRKITSAGTVTADIRSRRPHLPSNATPGPREGSLTFHLDNCASRDALFIGAVMGLFCDPVQSDVLALFRGGKITLGYDPIQPGEITIHSVPAGHDPKLCALCSPRLMPAPKS